MLFLLSACAEQPLIHQLSENAYQSIADDATRQLENLYPTAHTHLVITRQNETAFDRRFKTLLRNKGYAIHETQENSEGIKQQGKPFSYLLDALSNVSHYGYYRLTLTIGDAQLSRLYDEKALGKPNYWSYRP